mmetsp:Transcript_37362/g.96574  ORF Transcript_37362/g.96574 Transcript_37362/m.96574 type:complete len:89 (+) Transcript_37362:229-495(+)
MGQTQSFSENAAPAASENPISQVSREMEDKENVLTPPSMKYVKHANVDPRSPLVNGRTPLQLRNVHQDILRRAALAKGQDQEVKKLAF